MATTPSAQQLAITNLYVALFDRAPDAAGLNFWSQALINGASLDTLIQGFLTSPEAENIYPASQTSEQFVSAFYQTVFSRAPDAGGLVFWVDALNAAGGSGSTAARAWVVAQINAIVSTPLPTKPDNLSELEYAQTVGDRSIFANKVVVGAYFALDTPGTNLDIAKQALAVVDATASSVEAGKLIADGTSNGGDGTVNGQTYTLLSVTDTLVGTAANDTFNATHLTLSESDSIDGGGGTDTLNYVGSWTNGELFPTATIRNVETVNIGSPSGSSNDTLLVDATIFVGAKVFNVVNSAASVKFENLKADQTVGLIGNSGTFLTASYADDATTATLEMSGNSGPILAVLQGDNLTSARITTTGAASKVYAFGLAPTVTTVNIDAEVDLELFLGLVSLDSSGGGVPLEAGVLETITVAGAAANVGLGLVATEALTSLDASALSGGLKAALVSSMVVVKGGQGNDTILMGTSPSGISSPLDVDLSVFTGSVDAGGGDANLVGFAQGAILTVENGARFTNFQILQVSANGADQSYDTTVIDGISSYRVMESQNALELNKLANAPAKVTVTGDVSSLVLDFEDVGNAHTVDLTLDNTAELTNDMGAQVRSLTIGGTDRLNIRSAGLATGEDGANQVVIADSADHTTLSDVSITGSQALVLNLGFLADSGDLDIDASTFTGSLDIQGNDALQALRIQAGSGNTTISGSVRGDVITLAAGDDRVVYTSVSQSQLDLVYPAGTPPSTEDEIIGFVSGQDKIDLTMLTGAFIGQVLVSKTISSTSDIADDSSFFTVGGTAYRAVAATLGSDIYLVVDADENEQFEAASDLLVKLTGLSSFALDDLEINAAQPV